ncbi:MAG: hypothetical protein OHK0028_18570 [Deltaproteobacteria bacterium]
MPETPSWHATLRSRIEEAVDGMDLPPAERAEIRRRLDRCLDEGRSARSRQLEALGRLTGAVAHDFNNLLTGILGYASILKSAAAEGGEEHEAAATIERSARRASEMTRHLLNLTRGAVPEPRPVDVDAMIREAAAILSRTVNGNVEIRIEGEAVTGRVSGDEEELVEALVHLGRNGAEAMPGGGVLTFSTSPFQSDGTVRAFHATVPEGKYLSVCVSDTGSGIPEPIREEVFAPFFTTRSPDRGAGLGLPLVRSCMRSHRGFLRLASREGLGTTIQLLLPLDTSRD